jgi:hypothetical protein
MPHARGEAVGSPEIPKHLETRRSAYITPAYHFSMKEAKAGRAVSGESWNLTNS